MDNVSKLHQAEIQDTELAILSEFIKACKEHNLKWFAIFGTLLGAIRHKGFIPHDDDMDVAMPRRDYDFLRNNPQLFKEPFFLQTPQNDPAASVNFLKLRNSNTTAIPKKFPEIFTKGGNMGICIDIIPLDNMPSAEEANQLQRTIDRTYCQMKFSAALMENQGEKVPDFKLFQCIEMGGIANAYTQLAEQYEYLCSRCKESEFYFIPVLQGHLLKFRKQWFEKTLELDFENTKILVPSEYERILNICYPYGIDIEDLEEADKEKKHFAITDTEKPYTEYVKPYTDMLKNANDKEFLVFGAGDSLRIWFERYGLKNRTKFIFDNDPLKWETEVYGLSIKNPAELPKYINENTRILIASIHHKKINEQLQKMGIKDFYIFIDGWKYNACERNR
jgi:lipopolysaccharide cholinephosphotransferase